MSTPSPPDFLRESTAARRGRFMYDPSAIIVLSALVVHGGLHVLGEGLSARVELAGSSSLACLRHLQAKAGIVGLAQPAEIPWRIVPLVPVSVIHH